MKNVGREHRARVFGIPWWTIPILSAIRAQQIFYEPPHLGSIGFLVRRTAGAVEKT